MEFSERLKQCRAMYGLTQQQVAEKIGVNPTTYAHYESGRRTPDIEKLKQLCTLFGIAIQDHFPLVRTLEFPPQLLKDLAATKKRIAGELVSLESNRSKMTPQAFFECAKDLVKQLQAAIDPVKEIWEKTMDAPEMDIRGLPDGQTVMRVNYRAEDWQLLSESLRLQSRAMDIMFQR